MKPNMPANPQECKHAQKARLAGSADAAGRLLRGFLVARAHVTPSHHQATLWGKGMDLRQINLRTCGPSVADVSHFRAAQQSSAKR